MTVPFHPSVGEAGGLSGLDAAAGGLCHLRPGLLAQFLPEVSWQWIKSILPAAVGGVNAKTAEVVESPCRGGEGGWEADPPRTSALPDSRGLCMGDFSFRCKLRGVTVTADFSTSAANYKRGRQSEDAS